MNWLYKIKETPFTMVAESKEQALQKYIARDLELGKNAFYEISSIDSIEKLYTPFNVKKEIYNDHTFSGYASEALESFCYSLKEPYIRECDPNNPDDIEGADFMYTSKGMALVERFISRMYKVGINEYENGDIDVQSMAFYEE